jgi:7,8-dihydro-6-hydroxymethylpterin-pyrophosphokinase
VIAIVGVCASGKSTIVKRLLEEGIVCRHVAQEHSYVLNMWQRLTRPDFLICLDVSYPSTLSRKKLNWTLQEYEEQLRRIRHARAHADLVIDTDLHSVDEIVSLIKKGLITAGLVTTANGANGSG